jgi:hypothetical protein
MVARGRDLVTFVLAVVAPQEVSRLAEKPNAFGFWPASVENRRSDPVSHPQSGVPDAIEFN